MKIKSKSNIEIFANLREYIMKEDKYFNQELSQDYVKYLNYLEARCSNSTTITASTAEEKSETKTIEEQKNEIILLITNQKFEELQEKTYDYDILIEVLWDLLYCLPNSLIPKKIFNFFMSNSSSPSDSMQLLTCLPRANTSLFKLIIKLLNASSKNSSNSVDYSTWVNAIFHVNSTDGVDVERCISFLKLFV